MNKKAKLVETIVSTNHKVPFRIITANDVYKAKSFSILKGLRQKYSSSFPGVSKCIFPGDFLGGSIFSVPHEGESILDVCNQVGFDFVTIGNHEFDFGAKKLDSLIQKSNFKWFGSNIRYSDTKAIFSSIIDYEVVLVPVSSDHPDIFIRVGFFGLCTQDTPQLSHPTDDVIFEDVLDHATRISTHLKTIEKCDLVIAMTHVPLDQDKKIAEVGNIDVIIGGHDHEPYILEHREILILKCGQNLEYLGLLDFDISCTVRYNESLSVYEKGYVRIRRSLQLLSAVDASSDPEIDRIITKWNKIASGNAGQGGRFSPHIDMEQILTVVDANTQYPLSTKTSDCRISETNFPCLLADAFVWTFRRENLKCDFGIQNGGFIRGDRIYTPGTQITRSMIAEELPFIQQPVLIEMMGKDVVSALEQMLPDTPSPPPLGSYPHVSDGLTASFNLNNFKSGTPKVFDVKVNGEPINLESTYSVASTSFYVFEKADGVDAFNNKKVICHHADACKEAMMRYLLTLDSISGEKPKRLINLTKT